jgi:peptidoglycan/xylan/chitin deacetylase (PgdA/CDA1 family)
MKKSAILAVIVSIVFVLFSAVMANAVVSFTFDDGWSDSYNYAYPVLSKYGYVGTLFIISGDVGSWDGILTWNQISTLHSRGWEVANHTHSHPDLTTLSDSALALELDQSVSEFRAHGYTKLGFATPYGSYDDRVLKAIKSRFVYHRTAWDDGSPMDKYHITVYYDFDNTTTLADIQWFVTEYPDAWLVFCVHRVLPQTLYNQLSADDQQYAITQELFNQIASYLHTQGIKAITVMQGTNYYFINRPWK